MMMMMMMMVKMIRMMFMMMTMLKIMIRKAQKLFFAGTPSVLHHGSDRAAGSV
jgi:hypothetical protein